MIALEKVGARAGEFALRDVSVTLPAGAWGIVLGPAGAGKTTLLETIAGVRRATTGRVMLRGLDSTTLPPEHRRLGIVYQHGYLFPHLTVAENVGYGTSDATSVREISERLGADDLVGRPVASLSGGERQIVALARALAPRPDILLLDEPFAALDPRRRMRVRNELRLLQRERGMTVLHVTHDFAEAGTLGDLAIVLEEGRLSQVAAPAILFHKPASGAVADFLGAENVYAGQVERRVASEEGTDEGVPMHFHGEGIELVGMGAHPGGAGHAVIRGEDVVLSTQRPGPTSARNVLEGTILEVAPHGGQARVAVQLIESSAVLVAVVTLGAVNELSLAAGGKVVASIKATAVHLC
jgi:molybdopterin-binding protein